MNQVLRIGKSIRKIFEIKAFGNDLGFTLLWGENDYEFIGKLMSIINKQKQAILFSQKIKRLYEKLANVIIVTIKQKY